MKKLLFFLSIFLLFFILHGCASTVSTADVVATTKPVYDFTAYLCNGTGITVQRLITENVSCLHDYTLQVRQMRAIEAADTLVLSGAGLEDFLHDALLSANTIIDASEGIELHCDEHHHEHNNDTHHHSSDPHIWLSIKNARRMAENICRGLCQQYPECEVTLKQNMDCLDKEFDKLFSYGEEALSDLSKRNIITFHDGFSYFAREWNLNIIRSLEEESGSEASAAELKELIVLVNQYELTSIFTEENGSTSAAGIIAAETGIQIYTLHMGMSDLDYFDIMYKNIDAVKEALK